MLFLESISTLTLQHPSSSAVTMTVPHFFPGIPLQNTQPHHLSSLISCMKIATDREDMVSFQVTKLMACNSVSLFCHLSCVKKLVYPKWIGKWVAYLFYLERNKSVLILKETAFKVSIDWITIRILLSIPLMFPLEMNLQLICEKHPIANFT